MDRSIKKRIEAVRNGKNVKGYKATEIGLLPSDWSVTKLSDITEEITQEAGTDSYETVSISAGIGFVNQAEKFGKELSGKQYEKYKVLHKGDFSYNKGNSNKYPQGCIYRLNDRETAAVPNVFESFRIIKGCAEYYDQLFTRGFLNKQLSRLINHGVRDDGLLNLTSVDFYSCLLPVPPLKEQEKIAEILNCYDRIIELHEGKADKYKKLKCICLSKMFPQNGTCIPEWRFPGFTDDWEQRKLGEVFTQTFNFVNPKKDNIELWSLTVDEGLTPKTERYTRDFLVKKEDNFKEVRTGDIVYNPMNMTLGAIGYNNMPKSIAVSGYYVTMFANSNTDSYFINTWMKSPQAILTYKNYATGSLKEKQRVQFPTLSEITVHFPKLEEQQQIGQYFRSLDNLITLHQREAEENKRLKQALTQLLLTGIVRVNK